MVHILVAADRSDESRNAALSAFDIVQAVGGQVTAVHVGDGSDVAAEVLGRLEEIAHRREVPFEHEQLTGDVVDAITSYAAAHDVDAIYVGHRGMSSDWSPESGDRGRLGSVARGLVEGTQLPVTVFDRGL